VLQVSDVNGKNFRDIPTSGKSSPLTAVLPADLPRGSGCGIRLSASDAATSSTYAQPLSLHHLAKARFAVDSIDYHDQSFIALPLHLEGEAPWLYTVSTDSFFPKRQTYEAEDIMLVPNIGPTIFKLVSVANVCGYGIIEDPSAIKFEKVVGAQQADFNVSLSPNPFKDLIQLCFQGAGIRTIRIYDILGRLIQQTSVRDLSKEIHTKLWPSGMYVLTVEEQQRLRSFRIFKH
jgi:hypothetical protein